MSTNSNETNGQENNYCVQLQFQRNYEQRLPYNTWDVQLYNHEIFQCFLQPIYQERKEVTNSKSPVTLCWTFSKTEPTKHYN